MAAPGRALLELMGGEDEGQEQRTVAVESLCQITAPIPNESSHARICFRLLVLLPCYCLDIFSRSHLLQACKYKRQLKCRHPLLHHRSYHECLVRFDGTRHLYLEVLQQFDYQDLGLRQSPSAGCNPPTYFDLHLCDELSHAHSSSESEVEFSKNRKDSLRLTLARKPEDSQYAAPVSTISPV